VGRHLGTSFRFDTAVIGWYHPCTDGNISSVTSGAGMTVSAALWEHLGSMLAGIPGDRFGRRTVCRAMAVLYFVSALGCAFAWNWSTLVLFRFIGALASRVHRARPDVHRGGCPRLNGGPARGCFSSTSSSEILLAYLSKLHRRTMQFGPAEWRWKLGIRRFPPYFSCSSFLEFRAVPLAG